MAYSSSMFAALVRWSILVLALCASSAGTAQAQASSRTLLWKVTSPTRVMFVAGDTGLLTPSDLPLPAPLYRAFDASGELVVEGNDASDPQTAQALARQYALLPASKNLAGVLDKGEARKVADALDNLSVDANALQRMRPWYAALTLIDVTNRTLGCDPQQQEIAQFLRLAKARHLTVTPVERLAEQLELFGDLPRALEVEWLMSSARSASRPAPEREQARAAAVLAWRTGEVDSPALQFRGSPELYAAIVARRNARWAGLLEARLGLGGKPVFVVVGAAHTVGPDNLLRMLASDGYAVTQM